MKVQTKLVPGGWMVYVDGVEYLDKPRTLNVAEIIANNARVDIKNGVTLVFPVKSERERD